MPRLSFAVRLRIAFSISVFCVCLATYAHD